VGKGQTLEGRYSHLCIICKGTGKLNTHHKYVQRLKSLYEQHFNPSKKVESTLEELKEEPVRKSSSYAVMDKDYEVIVSEVNKKDQVEMGKLFTTRFEIKNVGQDWTQEHIMVVECGKTEGKRVSALKNGDKMVIELGPFVCKNNTILEKTYSLFYKDGEELVRFGHKFGFSVKGAKKIDIKKSDTIEREKEKLSVLKVISGSKKTEEYLALKLKSMGINVLNLELDDETIIEIIRQVK
jgi:hypothetical protein